MKSFHNKRPKQNKKQPITILKSSSIYITGILFLFVVIGLLTTLNPAYRLSFSTIEKWTSEIDSTTYLKFLGMENRAFRGALPENEEMPNLSATLFHLATNMHLDDPRSLLGQEIPGISAFENEIIVSGENTNYADLSFESSPPLEEVLKERKAIFEETDKQKTDKNPQQPSTGDRDVVFIYNTHNRESFLPHLPNVDKPNKAYHKDVNITKVSDRLKKGLESHGIGSVVDHTDIANKLNQRGWKHAQSYEASREVVQASVSEDKNLEYAIDLHRDSLPREKTTVDIEGKSYANVLFVVGAEHEDYKDNVWLARQLHKKLEEKYPGLSKAVITKKGSGVDGVYNQDLTDKALLIEFGGYENNLDELYRSADAVAEIFSDFYWNAEKVNKEGS